jgi:hypothetical protein
VSSEVNNAQRRASNHRSGPVLHARRSKGTAHNAQCAQSRFCAAHDGMLGYDCHDNSTSNKQRTVVHVARLRAMRVALPSTVHCCSPFAGDRILTVRNEVLAVCILTVRHALLLPSPSKGENTTVHHTARY